MLLSIWVWVWVPLIVQRKAARRRVRGVGAGAGAGAGDREMCLTRGDAPVDILFDIIDTQVNERAATAGTGPINCAVEMLA